MLLFVIATESGDERRPLICTLCMSLVTAAVAGDDTDANFEEGLFGKTS